LANSGTDWGLVISGITLALVAGGASWGIYKWVCHMRSFKNPVELVYLIPQRQYPAATFNGAPDNEIRPDKLTVGIGTYKVLHRLTPSVDILVDAMVLRFEGPDENKPKVHGPDNPYIVERIERPSGPYYRDWWGDIQPVTTDYPRYVYLGDTLAIGNRVETNGVWQGKSYFEVPIRGERKIVKKLDFWVTDKPGEDEIPFLRVANDEAGQKQKT